ncbi:MAG: NrdR family transcriptional regulator [Planctomycetota bacterium]
MKARRVKGKSPKHCPVCGLRSYVTDSRMTKTHVRRRRCCTCGELWTTHELILPLGAAFVIKRRGAGIESVTYLEESTVWKVHGGF